MSHGETSKPTTPACSSARCCGQISASEHLATKQRERHDACYQGECRQKQPGTHDALLRQTAKLRNHLIQPTDDAVRLIVKHGRGKDERLSLHAHVVGQPAPGLGIMVLRNDNADRLLSFAQGNDFFQM